jgi:hypothetical protein
MMKAKHTPRPWGIVGTRIQANDGQIVAQLNGAMDTEEELWANARLIAAAPKLAAELQRKIDECSCHYGGFGEDGLCGQPCKSCESARAALREAGIAARD